MKKLLVFGGTRFFGEKVVASFLRLGYQVTIATRGLTPDSFGDTVNRIEIDRSNADHPAWIELTNTHWDVVFDNICFTKEDAEITCRHLKEVSHYLLTSSLAVYKKTPPKTGFTETDFTAASHIFDDTTPVDYGEGKRQAEHYFTHNYSNPVTFLRFPVVLDDDDYTERLHFYLRAIKNNETIKFQNDNGRFSFVRASEIPNMLQFVVNSSIVGPLNLASNQIYTTDEFITRLGQASEKDELSIAYEDTTWDKLSPFAKYPNPMSVATLIGYGYPVSELDDWLPALMTRLYNQIK